MAFLERKKGEEEGGCVGEDLGCVSGRRGGWDSTTAAGTATAATGPKGRGPPTALLLPAVPDMYILLAGDADTDRRREEEE
jgi:hypothetical protein